MSDTLRTLGRIGGHLLFWGWNLLFLTVVWLGIGPAVLGPLAVATWAGVIPLHFAAFGAALLALPVAGLAIGLWKLRTDPGRLLSLFYGVQVPLMLLCLVRLFAVQQLVPATALALMVGLVGCLGLLRTLLHGFEERTAPAQVLRLAAQSAYGVAGLWWAALVAIYAGGLCTRIAVEVLESLDAELFWSLLRELPGMLGVLPFLALGAVTWAVLLVFPFAMLGISLRAWQVVHRATAARSVPLAWTVSIGTTAALLLAFAATARQPQHAAFAHLAVATTDDARLEALHHSDAIRRGLLAARLGPERLFEADPSGRHVVELYDDFVGRWLAEGIAGSWRALMAPFSYRPVDEGRARSDARWMGVPADVARATEAYESFFDAPMARAEQRVLLSAARQTWDWRKAEAGLLDIGERRVHLSRQEIDVEAAGDLATVMIHDVYRNRTWERQEVLLALSLPETAALTGLWLGPSADRAEAFEHVVAPRGAAQEVYKAEVRRRVDPALLEQVGPRQYRLRAFPVEPRTGEPSDVRSLTAEGPELHLWLELVVAADADGQFTLPQTNEVRNLFWDRDSERTLDGAAFRADGWTPGVAGGGAPLQAHEAVVGGLRVRAEPAVARSAAPGRIAVLVDGTRSMDARRSDVAASLAELRAAGPVSVACTREGVVGACDDFDPSTALFWGAVPLETQVASWRAVAGGADAWVVLTDQGSYELSADDEGPGLDWPSGEPLWLVHLGGAFPAAYPDATLDALQRSGGGVAGDVSELLEALADPAVRDGWRWSFAESGEGPSEGPFARLAARQAIAELDRRAEAGTLDHLDAVHQLARAHSVVTPYSSMIVLVNDRQKQALADAEQREDRFEREVERGTEEFASVTSTPEPGTWLLLAVGGGLLLAGRRRV